MRLPRHCPVCTSHAGVPKLVYRSPETARMKATMLTLSPGSRPAMAYPCAAGYGWHVCTDHAAIVKERELATA